MDFPPVWQGRVYATSLPPPPRFAVPEMIGTTRDPRITINDQGLHVSERGRPQPLCRRTEVPTTRVRSHFALSKEHTVLLASYPSYAHAPLEALLAAVRCDVLRTFHLSPGLGVGHVGVDVAPDRGPPDPSLAGRAVIGFEVQCVGNPPRPHPAALATALALMREHNAFDYSGTASVLEHPPSIPIQRGGNSSDLVRRVQELEATLEAERRHHQAVLGLMMRHEGGSPLSPPPPALAIGPSRPLQDMRALFHARKLSSPAFGGGDENDSGVQIVGISVSDMPLQTPPQTPPVVTPPRSVAPSPSIDTGVKESSFTFYACRPPAEVSSPPPMPPPMPPLMTPTMDE